MTMAPDRSREDLIGQDDEAALEYFESQFDSSERSFYSGAALYTSFIETAGFINEDYCIDLGQVHIDEGLEGLRLNGLANPYRWSNTVREWAEKVHQQTGASPRFAREFRDTIETMDVLAYSDENNWIEEFPDILDHAFELSAQMSAIDKPLEETDYEELFRPPTLKSQKYPQIVTKALGAYYAHEGPIRMEGREQRGEKIAAIIAVELVTRMATESAIISSNLTSHDHFAERYKSFKKHTDHLKRVYANILEELSVMPGTNPSKARLYAQIAQLQNAELFDKTDGLNSIHLHVANSQYRYFKETDRPREMLPVDTEKFVEGRGNFGNGQERGIKPEKEMQADYYDYLIENLVSMSAVYLQNRSGSIFEIIIPHIRTDMLLLGDHPVDVEEYYDAPIRLDQHKWAYQYAGLRDTDLEERMSRRLPNLSPDHLSSGSYGIQVKKGANGDTLSPLVAAFNGLVNGTPSNEFVPKMIEYLQATTKLLRDPTTILTVEELEVRDWMYKKADPSKVASEIERIDSVQEAVLNHRHKAAQRLKAQQQIDSEAEKKEAA